MIDALHVLALRCTTASSAREALVCWHEDVADELKAPLRQVSRRLALGASVAEALMPLARFDAPAVAVLTSVMADGSRQGSALAASVCRVATMLEHRAEMTDHARNSSVASRASTRLLAALAVASVLLLPQWRAAPPSLVAVVVLVAGSLTWTGVRWVRKLSPRPPCEDPEVALFAEAVARGLSAGSPPDAALMAACPSAGPLRTQLTAAMRRRRMGAAWPVAFASVDDPSLTALGNTIASALRNGAPLEPRLLSFAGALRRQAQRDFELRARKAPVMLVLPLTLCFLPAFALVVVVPLLGGLTT